METPAKIHDLGVKTPIFGNTHLRNPYFLPTNNFYCNAQKSKG